MINTGLPVQSETVRNISAERVVLESNTKPEAELKKSDINMLASISKQADQGDKEISEEAVLKAIKDANKKIQSTGNEFEFSIHEKTKQIMVKVVNTATKEVVREIPSEKILDMVASMCEVAGLFVDEKR
jgi:flagellar protein FlaG